jgi:putative restriction endonuclease
MSRVTTALRILSRRELVETVLSAIKDSGWNYNLPYDEDFSFPVKISITDGIETQLIAIYIWNVSHGGKTRSKEEYRIQIKGEPPLQTGNDYKTLLLGWFEQDQIFAAYDAFKHRNYSGRSPSIQVPRQTLDAAVTHPFAFHTKQLTNDGKEVVVAFSKPFFIEYLNFVYPQYHAHFAQGISSEEAEIIENNYLDEEIPGSVIEELTEERQTAIVTMQKRFRERRFQRDVWFAYNHGQCAICGLQGGLTEAAHIIPVTGAGNNLIANGIQLCRNHHKAFANGIIAVSPNYTILLNYELVNKLRSAGQGNELQAFIDGSRIRQRILLPSDISCYPNTVYLAHNCRLKGIQPTLP